MRSEWMKLIKHIFANDATIRCPNCGRQEVEYVYIGDKETRISYFLIWCNSCLKGIYVSRAIAPHNAKFMSYEEADRKIIPKFEILND